MRVLLLSDRIPPTVGGAGKVAWSLACGLRDEGDEVHIVTATAGAPGRETRQGVTVHSIAAHVPDRWRAYLSLYNPPAVKAFRDILDRVRPDVVNPHNVHVDLSYACLTAARRNGIPVVLTAHDVMPIAYEKLQHYVSPSRCPPPSADIYRLPPFHNLRQARRRYNPFRNVVIRRILRRDVNIRVAVSAALRAALEANGLPGFRVVHNGVAAEEWRAPEEEKVRLRDRLGLERRQVILLAGRIGRAKGSLQALEALRLILADVPAATLLVLSPREFPLGPYERTCKDHVRFAGWLVGTELAAAYAISDVVILPSIYLDALPLVSIEAMASRKPVIASCHGGSPEVVQDGKTGYIVNPFDAPSFAARLVEVLRDEALQRRLGEAGHQRFLAEFTQERLTERMSAIFGEAMS